MSEFWNEFKNGLNRNRLLNPFITTDAERVRNQQTELAGMQAGAQLKNFNRDQEYQAKLQKHELWKLGRAKTKALQSDEIYKENRELKKLAIEDYRRKNRIADYKEKKQMIGEHSTMAMQNLTKSVENATADMSDVERDELYKSKEFREQHQVATFGRLAGNALKSKTPEEKARNMELVNQYAGEYGYTIAEQDGQYYLSGENIPAGFILNGQNFAQINNAVAKSFANEIKIRKKLISDKSNVYGVGKIDAINRITAVLPEDEKGSWTKASKIFAGIGKDMNKADVNVYSLRQNITKFLEDGAIDERERQALLQNMAILADATGTKYELGADGNPLVIKEDGNRVGLKQFAEELRSKDKLGNAIDRFEKQAKRQQESSQRLNMTFEQMDIGGTMNRLDLGAPEKKKFRGLLRESLLGRVGGESLESLEKNWFEKAPKGAVFPYGEEYYPKAIEEARGNLLRLVGGENRTASKITPKDVDALSVSVDISGFLAETFGDERQAKAKETKARTKADAKVKNHKTVVKERNKASKELQGLIERYKEFKKYKEYNRSK